MKHINNLSLPVTIMLSSLILGGFYFASTVVKQVSVGKQQQIEQQAKLRDYKMKRSEQCLDIYKVETTRDNGFWDSKPTGYEYDIDGDKCWVTYTTLGGVTRKAF